MSLMVGIVGFHCRLDLITLTAWRRKSVDIVVHSVDKTILESLGWSETE